MDRTSELLSALLKRNEVAHDQLVSIIFTSTKDLRSAFPALAARELGLGDVPLLCAGELDVVGGNPNTIRVLIHCYSTLPRPGATLPAPRQAPPRRLRRNVTSTPNGHAVAIVGTGLPVPRWGWPPGVGAPSGWGLTRPRELRDALELEAITSRARSVEEAAEGADLIVAATPVRSLPGVLARALAANPEAVLTDVGSTKLHLLVELQRSSANLRRVIPGHPMAGSEGGGTGRRGPVHVRRVLTRRRT